MDGHLPSQQYTNQGLHPLYYNDALSVYSNDSAYGGPIPRSAVQTPISSYSETQRQTRNTRSTTRTDSPNDSIGKPTKRKRGKAGRVEKPNTPHVESPLSVLTKDMVDIPVRDMEKWVNRSTETRLKEVEKRKGYIARPMNSFMLYRSAYAERTKVWCTHNNHQVVSSVSGESWPLEPPEVREFYNELAKIERINHQNAHPNYKFSPVKPGQNKKKKKGGHGDDTDLSDHELDADWGRGRKTRRTAQDHLYSSRPASLDPHGNLIHPWEAGHMAQVHPQDIGRHDPYGGHMPYYQQSFNPHQEYRTEPMGYIDPHTYASHSSGMIGLPGSSHHDLLGLNSRTGTPLSIENPIDPLLLHSHDAPYNGHGMPHPVHPVLGSNMRFDESLHAEPPFEESAFSTEPSFLLQNYQQPPTSVAPEQTIDRKGWEAERDVPVAQPHGGFGHYWDGQADHPVDAAVEQDPESRRVAE